MIPDVVRLGAVVVILPSMVVYHTTVSPEPAVALPVCELPSSQTVTSVPVGAVGKSYIVTVTAVRVELSQFVVVFFAAA